MAHAIRETTLDGHEALVLGAPDRALEAWLVPGAGMVCARLTQDGRPLLHEGDGVARWAAGGATFGVPLLHPWANRLERLSYAVDGHHVLLDPERMPVRDDGAGLPIHGLLHATGAWRVTRREAGPGEALVAARLESRDVPGLEAGFPFPHELDLVVRLAGDLLSWSLTLTATAEHSVPVAFGFHPYLTLPGLPREQWELSLPVVRRAMLDGRGIPTGQTGPAPFRSGPLGQRSFDDLFPLLDEPAEFVVAGGGGALRVRFDQGYPHTQVYSPPGGPFICFEPMTAPTDALRRGGRSLPRATPGSPYTARWSLLVDGRPGV
jgi:galactose mutarotase-like enzyme